MNEDKDKQQRLFAGIRSYFSIQHLSSAYYLSKQVKEIEDNFDKKNISSVYLKHRTFTVGSLFFISSFLETYINEFYSDVSDNMLYNYKGINKEKAITLASHWKRNNSRTARYSTLRKYEIALDILSNDKFAIDKTPYHDVKLLISLRNNLIHYKSEWIYLSPPKLKDKDLTNIFEKLLKDKFNLNPTTEKGNPFFPDKCLGYGCLYWGIVNSISFILDFFEKSKINPSNLENILKIKELITNKG